MDGLFNRYTDQLLLETLHTHIMTSYTLLEIHLIGCLSLHHVLKNIDSLFLKLEKINSLCPLQGTLVAGQPHYIYCGLVQFIGVLSKYTGHDFITDLLVYFLYYLLYYCFHCRNFPRGPMWFPRGPRTF